MGRCVGVVEDVVVVLTLRSNILRDMMHASMKCGSGGNGGSGGSGGSLTVCKSQL